jgi:hypothetical protein
VGTSRTFISPIRFILWFAVASTIAALVGLQSLPVRAGAPAQILYGADGAGGNPATNLYTLDPSNGAVLTTVGPVGFAVTGLAFHPTTGILYGTTGGQDPTNPAALIAINPTTGAGVLVGDHGAGTSPVADITFGADGTLFGWWEETDDLVTIDLLTGAATVVGEAGFSTRGSALAGSGNPLILFGNDDDGCVSLIDTGTGTRTCPVNLDGTGESQMNASDFDAGGTLFAVRFDGAGGTQAAELVTVDTTTGAITVVGASVTGLDAIAFSVGAPEPSVVPSVPNAATDQPMTDPLSGVLWILGMATVVGVVGLTVRTLAVVRNR